MQSTPVLHPKLTHDLLHEAGRPLDCIFSPRNVAVVGATETPKSVGRTVLWNLVSNLFGGTVFPVNPKRSSVLGIRAYPRIADCPEPVELAVIVTPSSVVPGVIGECAAAGVKGAIIISAGFKEMGAEGAELERQILRQARTTSMRIIGPNCLGVMNPVSGLNATFAGGMARPGNVGFISQSGALCTAILDWSLREQVGFSAFVSVGSMLDVGWGDLIDHLGYDPHTKSILVYMETIGDARSFLSAAREVSLSKPIIVIKAGRSEAAAKAAASHTGSLAGSDEVLEAAFRRTGVLRVSHIDDLFYMAEVLAKQPRPAGPRLTIVTNAGGPAVLATDSLIATGGELAGLDPKSLLAFNEILPPHWSRANPIDILGDAGPDRYEKALRIALQDPSGDGLLVILTPQDMTDATRTAETIKSLEHPNKPILASWMGGASVAAGEDILNRSSIPTFGSPDTAARAFTYMWKYSYNLKGIYETPELLSDDLDSSPQRQETARKLIERARKDHRTLLSEVESKELLSAHGIPTVESVVATTVDEAQACADRMGYPIVVKLFSNTITHKTDVDGVRLNLRDGGAVRAAFDGIRSAVIERKGAEHFQGVTVQPMVRKVGYEIILGSSVDPQFGPVLLFGAGGELVEVMKDRALALPPLNATLARRMMEQTRIFAAFKGVRGRPPIDMAQLENILVLFSRMIVEQPFIRECDINPLLVSHEQIIALDGRVVLHDPHTPVDRLPRPAIRPYPTQYVATGQLRDGPTFTIRPIRPEDEPLLVRFHEGLSENTVHLRFFTSMKLSRRITHERLARVCFNDYDRELALVAEHKNPQTGDREILGVGRISKVYGTKDAEFSMLIGDAWQNHGLGTELLSRLIQIGRDEKLGRITADILPENTAMQKVCTKLGFVLERSLDEPIVKAALTL